MEVQFSGSFKALWLDIQKADEVSTSVHLDHFPLHSQFNPGAVDGGLALDILSPVADTQAGVEESSGGALVSWLGITRCGGSNSVVEGSAFVNWSVDISWRKKPAYTTFCSTPSTHLIWLEE